MVITSASQTSSSSSASSSLIGRSFADVLWSGVCGCGRAKRTGGAWCRGCAGLLDGVGVAAEAVGYHRCLEVLLAAAPERFVCGELKDEDGWGIPEANLSAEEKACAARPVSREVDGSGWVGGIPE